MTGPAEQVIESGTLLAHYQIKDILGSGAMGTVYRAHDTALDRSVAVKVLRSRLAEEPAVVDRFVREARAAARVNHPNLTHIYFVGAQDGSQFFAMEYVPGTTLEAEIATNGPMELGRFVDVITQAARGLAAAHGAGVVHRDVKPSNLMLLPNGTVKVTDFGLAKSLDGDVGASGGGMLLGTPTYMSPEQCRGKGVDVRTDVYALGLTAWFLLGGRPPYTGESIGQMIQDHMNTPLPSIRDLRPELPPALDRTLARMCEKDPAKRPPSMNVVAAAFEQFRPRPLDPSTFAARAGALFVDWMAVLLVWGCVFGAMALFERWIHIAIPVIVGSVAFVAALFFSQFVSEASLGTSLGKWMFNLEVVRADGASPSRRTLFARFLIRFPIALLVFGALTDWMVAAAFILQALTVMAAIACFWAYGRRTLSDIVTKTRVVYRSSRGAAPAAG